MTKKRGITIGHVGLGKWGLTLFDNFSALAGCRVKYACDLRQELLSKLQGEFDTKFIDDVNEMLADEEVEAVVVATEAPSHYKIALSALKHNKHVYIEKPITLDIAQAEELVELAKKNNKKIMVGHLLLYHPAIKKLKELLRTDTLVVSIMHANNEIGTLLPLEQVGEICAKYDAIFHSDTVQTMGHYPMDLQKIKVHFFICVLGYLLTTLLKMKIKERTGELEKKVSDLRFFKTLYNLPFLAFFL